MGSSATGTARRNRESLIIRNLDESGLDQYQSRIMNSSQYSKMARTQEGRFIERSASSQRDKIKRFDQSSASLIIGQENTLPAVLNRISGVEFDKYSEEHPKDSTVIRLEQAEERNRALCQEILDLNKANSHAKAELEREYLKENERMYNTIVRLEGELKKQKDEEPSTSVASQPKLSDQLTEKIQNLEQELTRSKLENQDLHSILESEQETSLALKSTITKLSSELKRLTSDTSSLKLRFSDELCKKDAAIESLSAEVNKLQSSRNEEVERLQKKYKHLKKKNKKKKKQMMQLQEESRKNDEENSKAFEELKNKLFELVEENQRLAMQVESRYN